MHKAKCFHLAVVGFLACAGCVEPQYQPPQTSPQSEKHQTEDVMFSLSIESDYENGKYSLQYQISESSLRVVFVDRVEGTTTQRFGSYSEQHARGVFDYLRSQPWKALEEKYDGSKGDGGFVLSFRIRVGTSPLYKITLRGANQPELTELCARLNAAIPSHYEIRTGVDSVIPAHQPS